ncbi:MAG: hypothetical protein AAFU53_01095 [Cyanobacteria bacterium J06632_3]
MQTTNSTPAQRPFCLIAALLCVLCLVSGCARSSNLLTDETLIANWAADQSSLRSLVEESCRTGASIGTEIDSSPESLAERYRVTDRLFPTTAMDRFYLCNLPESDLPDSTAADSAFQPQYLAQSEKGEAYLLVADRYRKGTGLIEETVSRWTGGWISWKSTIWEEKGLVYVAQSGAQPGLSVFELALERMEVAPEPLDQFSGRYRVTSQVSGNGCSVWRLRPTESPNWYLFYHQARECAV